MTISKKQLHDIINEVLDSEGDIASLPPGQDPDPVLSDLRASFPGFTWTVSPLNATHYTGTLTVADPTRRRGAKTWIEISVSSRYRGTSRSKRAGKAGWTSAQFNAGNLPGGSKDNSAGLSLDGVGREVEAVRALLKDVAKIARRGQRRAASMVTVYDALADAVNA
jgi:hypothetical protein